jgi:hypothetical protein
MAYLVMIFAPLRSLRRIGREASSDAHDEGQQEIYYYSAAFQASLVAYIVCSCFGSIQYLWFLYYPLAYAVSIRRIHEAESLADSELPAKIKIVEPRPRAVLWKPRQMRKRNLALSDSEAPTSS